MGAVLLLAARTLYRMGRVWDVPAVVVRVVDADTIVCHLDMGWRHWQHDAFVRLLAGEALSGIDAPEDNTPSGRTAEEYVRTLAPAGALVRVISHKVDNFGRTLGRMILADGRDLGQHLLETGYAVPKEYR